MSDIIWETDRLKVKHIGDRLHLLTYDGWIDNGIPEIEITQFAKFWLTENGFEVTKKKPVLKPCPLCMGTNVGLDTITYLGNRICAGCFDCRIRTASFDNEEEAIETWNALPRKEGGTIG
jgi:hypothetical protein